MRTALRRRDPRRADCVVYAASNALAVACGGNAKLLASTAGVAETTARGWLRGAQGSPVATCFELLLSLGERAEAIVVTARVLLHQSVLRMSSANLVADFWKAMSAETRAQGIVDLLQVRDHWTEDDLRQLVRAATDEARHLERLAAIAHELLEQRILPHRGGA